MTCWLCVSVDRCRLVTRDEMQTNCCYAVQDKTWIQDPDGNAWGSLRRTARQSRPATYAVPPRVPQPIASDDSSDRLRRTRRGYDDESLESLAIQTDAWLDCFKAGCSKRKKAWHAEQPGPSSKKQGPTEIFRFKFLAFFHLCSIFSFPSFF